MDPLTLGAVVAVCTILVLFSGVSVGLGLLIVSTGFIIIFDGLVYGRTNTTKISSEPSSAYPIG